jgi:hypothetical protein
MYFAQYVCVCVKFIIIIASYKSSNSALKNLNNKEINLIDQCFIFILKYYSRKIYFCNTPIFAHLTLIQSF